MDSDRSSSACLLAACLLSIWLYLYSDSFAAPGFWVGIQLPTEVLCFLFLSVALISGFPGCFWREHKKRIDTWLGLLVLIVLITVAPAFVTGAMFIGWFN